MGFHESLRNFLRADPTRDWPGAPPTVPTYEFATHALCGVRLGDPFERLMALGRPEDASQARAFRFRWYSKGLEAEADPADRRIVYVRFVWQDYLNEGFEPCRALFTVDGKPLALGRDVTEDQVVATFGAPSTRDVDDDEIVITHRDRNRTIEWEFTLDGRLKQLAVWIEPSP